MFVLFLWWERRTDDLNEIRRLGHFDSIVRHLRQRPSPDDVNSCDDAMVYWLLCQKERETGHVFLD